MISIHTNEPEGTSTTYCWLTKAIGRDVYIMNSTFVKQWLKNFPIMCVYIWLYALGKVWGDAHLAVKNDKVERGHKK